MGDVSERTLLLESSNKSAASTGLSVLFAIVCIVDVFGVFPIVALPKAIINCGYYGILVVLIVSSVQIYTASLLGRCWLIAEKIDTNISTKNRYPYAGLAEMTYGKYVSKFSTFLLDITVFGAGIPNLIVASQNLQLLGMRLTDNSFNLSYCYWILLIGTILCPVLWLGSPKDMKLLCSLSVVLVISVFVLVWGIILFDKNEIIDVTVQQTRQVPLWNSVLSAYGILSFQFDIHPTILTIQVDMKNKTKVSKAVLGGFAATLTMFCLTTIGVGLRYGNATRASLLETLPSSIFLHFAALLVAMQLCLSSAVGNTALYQNMEDCMNISREFNHKRCLLRTTLTVIAVLLAESVPRFDIVMSLIGGTLTGPLVYILPPLFFIKMIQLQHNFEMEQHAESCRQIIHDPSKVTFRDVYEEEIQTAGHLNSHKTIVKSTKFIYFRGCEILFCVIVILIGLCVTVATTYVNVVNTIEFASFSSPCILNITSASLFVGG